MNELDRSKGQSVVPPPLRGTLASAWAQHRQLSSRYTKPKHFHIEKIHAYDQDGSRKIRTRPDVLRTLLHDINDYTRGVDRNEATSTLLQTVMNRLSETGAFTDVNLRLTPSKPTSLQPKYVSNEEYEQDLSIPRADLGLGLSERSYALNTGVSGTPQGSLEAYTEGSLVNLFGSLETITCKILASKNKAVRAEWGLSETPSQAASAKETNAFNSIASPSIELSFTKPTINGTLWGVRANARMDEDDFMQRSRFVNKVTEADFSFVSPNKRHSTGIFCSWRNPVCTSAPGRVFKADAPPEIIKDCSSSVASGIRYQYDCNRRKGETTPIHGTYTRGLVELTHPVLGGDTSYLRLEHGYEWIQSWGRRMPDTGYQKPLSRSHFNAQAKSKSTNSLVDSDLFSQEWNRPQMSETETEKNDKFTMSHQILGWLSPGITARTEWKGGLLLSPKLLGHIRRAPNAEDKKSSFVSDRYYLGAPSFRGFTVAGIGPHSTSNSNHRVSLGGDLMGLFTARLLLPPPVPSITLANAGMRFQLFASAGTLLSDDEVVASGREILSSSKSVPSLVQEHGRASAGVGIWLPIGQNAGLEATWTLWQASQPSDSRASFSLGISQ